MKASFLSFVPGPRAAFSTGLLALAIALFTTISARAADVHRGLPDLDRRARLAAAPAPARDAAEIALRGRVRRLKIERDEIVGTPKWIASPEGLLTGPNGLGGSMPAVAPAGAGANDPQALIKGFLEEHKTVFGHGSAVLDRTARLSRDQVTSHNGLHTLRWEQSLSGLPLHGSALTAHVTRNGEIVSVGSTLLADPAAAATQPPTPSISAVQTLALAAQQLQFVLDPISVQQVTTPEGRELTQELSAPGWRRPAQLSLAWLPTGPNSLRLAWHIYLANPQDQVGYELMLDATTGELLTRRCLTADASAASFRVFTQDSPTPLFPAYSKPVTNQPAAVSRSLVTLTSLSATASPNGWVDDGQLVLQGNNAHVFWWKPTGQNSYQGETVTGTAGRVFDAPLDLTHPPTEFGPAAAINAFYWVNWMHDKLYALGFDEASGNCQGTNFNRGGKGKDFIQIYVQDPGTEDNAGMTTWPEGKSPELDLGIYGGAEPDRDSSYASEIILHEYTHALSNRLVGGGVGISAHESKGMGEGWSDFYSISLLIESTDDPAGTYPHGAYTGLHMWGLPFEENYYFGVRRYPYSTDMSRNPLTYADIFNDQADSHLGIPSNPVLFGFSSEEVHMQGEVWCSILWEARANLVTKHGFSTGNQLMLQLVTDSMKLCPANPNFIQGRDAILQADTVNNGGANHKELWAGFAKRGLGVGATSTPNPQTGLVTESFDSLDALTVLPSRLPAVTGPVGGPFTPFNIPITLTNDSASSLSWKAGIAAPFELSSAAGSVAGKSRQSISIRLNAAAAATLPVGITSLTLRITNVTSGSVFARVVPLVIGVSYPPMQLFDGASAKMKDLSSGFLTFTPDSTGTNYTVCQSSSPLIGSSFGAKSQQPVDFGDDHYVPVTLTNGFSFPYFGKSYQGFSIGVDGSLVFGGTETNELSTTLSISRHFAAVRIAGLSYYYNRTNGLVAWQQLADRVLVTWEGVQNYSAPSQTNTFQIVLHQDGRINLNVLRCDTAQGICGLSGGGGTPLYFEQTDLLGAAYCNLPPLFLSVPSKLKEVTLGRPTVGHVWQSFPANVDTTITLTSSDTGEVTVPASVVIPAGSTGAVFNVTVQDDAIRDGTQLAFITASAYNRTPATAPVLVSDNETATISLTMSSSVTEGGLFGFGSVSLDAPAGGLVTVQLGNPRPEELYVPPTVFIPAGQTSAVFLLSAINDNRIDGTQNVTVTASVENWVSGSDTVAVVDNENTQLTLLTPFLASESTGTIPTGGQVRISGILPTNLVVSIFSDDETEVNVPVIPVTIPAGATNAFFPLFIQDDAVVDGLIIAQIRATAIGFTPGTNSVWVLDNDGPPDPFDPYPAHNATEVPLQISLSWAPLDGELIENGNFETGDLTGWSTHDDGDGGWVLNDGSFNPESPESSTPPGEGSYSALVQQVGNGTHVLWQDVFIPDGAATVTLGWSDRVHNFAPDFSAHQQFRVEVRNPANNAVLETLFVTTPGQPAASDWTDRGANLAGYRGQKIRIAFVEEDSKGYLNVHLDRISLLAPAVAQTSFDVYFGTNSTPTAANFLGSTTTPVWPLPGLAGGVDYYWQVNVRRSSVTNTGPVWHFTTLGDSTNTTVLTFGSSWKYISSGANMGTGWRSPGYNDILWQNGTAPLGFGGGQTTVIGNAASNFVTFYFRRKLALTDTNRLAEVRARLRRDDGAVVYVNGTEAFRSNMPSRTLDYLTSASTDISGFAELLLVNESLSPSLFIEGTNVIAVEIHQYCGRTGCSDDLIFDLELTTRTNAGNLPPNISWTAPADFALVHQPTNVVLSTSLSDDGLLLGYNVSFYADGEKLGEDTLPPFSFTWNNPPPGLHSLVAVARDPGGLTNTTPVRHLMVAPPAGQASFTLVPAGSDWRYSDTGTDLGTAWRGLSYRDSRWKHGPAQLGYGDGDEATLVGYGGDPLDRHITTYFRRSFSLPAIMSSLSLRLIRDDGIIVYLNGTEIFRNNMPLGVVSNSTPAVFSLNPPDESNWINANINSSVVVPLLRAGNNTIAVEVHQASPSSSDLSFNLELTGIGHLLPTVAIDTPVDGATFVGAPSIPISASASSPYGSGSITKVELFDGAGSLGSLLSAPYGLNWAAPSGGIHTLTAIATDSSGGSASSSPVTVIVYQPTSLTFQPSGGQLQLSWPLSAGPYSAETTTNLAPPVVWEALTNSVSQGGGQYLILVDPTEDQRYFRLRGPN